MQPTDKAPALNDLLSAIAGKDRIDTIKANKCMTCTGDAATFKDGLSRREYAISGMCQRCQDEVWQ